MIDETIAEIRQFSTALADDVQRYYAAAQGLIDAQALYIDMLELVHPEVILK